MSLFSFIFGQPCNVEQGHEKQTNARSLARSYIVPRQDYIEESRQYTCNFIDLFKLIKNDRRLLARKHAGSKVLVIVMPQSMQAFEVKYAVVLEGVLNDYPAKQLLLIPESWLLYRALEPQTIYSIDGDKPYWAYLGDDKKLYTSSQSGLMQNASFFIDALGLSQATPLRSTSIAGLLPKNGQLPVYWYVLPFLLVNNRQAKQSRWNLLPLLSLSGISALVLMGLLSGWLAWKQSSLQHDVQELRAQANEIFDVQQQLDNRLALIAQYKSQMQKFPAQSDIIRYLVQDIGSLASLTRIQSSAALVTIEGTGENATDVLAKLSNSPHWSEVRFDKRVTTTQSGQSFSISMVFKRQEQQQAAGK